MDVLTVMLIVAAVTMLVVGGYLAVSVPRAIRQAGGSMIVKGLGVMLLGGGACGLLALGGAILAALAGAADAAVWLGVSFMAAGVVALSVLGFTLYAVWRSVTGTQRPHTG